MELDNYNESRSMKKGASEKRLRGRFLSMNVSSCLSLKTGGGTIIANSIGDPRKVGERAKLFSLHLPTAYDQ